MQNASKTHGKRVKTVLRTIRIPSDMDVLLQSDANAKNLSVNALISSILRKYAEWDRLAEDFGFIGIHHETLTRILLAIEDDEIAQIGTELGEKLGREAPLFWFKECSVEAFVTVLSLHAKYTGAVRCEVQWEGGKCTVLYQHNSGMKWSLLTKHFTSSALKTMFGILPVCEIGERTAVVRFQCSQSGRETAET
jgi:hypothetical protein